MFHNLLASFFSERFGRGSKVSAATTSSTQDAAIATGNQGSQLEKEIAALITHYDIRKGESRRITTTLSEIEGVVYRQRRRADAYVKLLSELKARTGAAIEIVNNRKSNN